MEITGCRTLLDVAFLGKSRVACSTSDGRVAAWILQRSIGDPKPQPLNP